MCRRTRVIRAALAVGLIGSSCFYYSGSVRATDRTAGRATAIRIETTDPVLRDEVCSYFAQTSSAQCTSGPASRAVRLSLEVGASEPEILRSLLLSTATLTTGVFLFRAAPGVLHVHRSSEVSGGGGLTLRGFGRTGFFAFLPLYAGLIATAAGGWAVDIDEPAELQQRCMRERMEKSCERYRGYVRSLLDVAGGELRQRLRPYLEGTIATTESIWSGP